MGKEYNICKPNSSPTKNPNGFLEGVFLGGSMIKHQGKEERGE